MCPEADKQQVPPINQILIVRVNGRVNVRANTPGKWKVGAEVYASYTISEPFRPEDCRVTVFAWMA